MRRVISFVLVLLALAVGAAPAGAQTLRTPAAEYFAEAAQSLRTDPVFVHPDADPTISQGEADDLRNRIEAQGAEPLYIAILPAEARQGLGDPRQLAARLYESIQRPGVYAVVSERGLFAGRMAM